MKPQGFIHVVPALSQLLVGRKVTVPALQQGVPAQTVAQGTETTVVIRGIVPRRLERGGAKNLQLANDLLRSCNPIIIVQPHLLSLHNAIPVLRPTIQMPLNLLLITRMQHRPTRV